MCLNLANKRGLCIHEHKLKMRFHISRWACARYAGLRDIPATSHAFNDWNHCDLTPMADEVQEETNANGAVAGISRQNRLGPAIRTASLPELGPGGSWSTCILGAGKTPPSDVAHVQFRSRVAFKLVWVPPLFSTFVLVDDDGKLLAQGTPQEGSGLPSLRERKANYDAVTGGKYAVEAERISTAGHS